jgi:pimeloyl-ACP methyl ester carboxylesterase
MTSRAVSFLKKAGLRLLQLLAGLYLLAMALLYFLQESILFFPTPADPALAMQQGAEAVEVDHDGTVLRGWYVAASDPGADTVIFYGGNGDEMSRSLAAITALGDYNYLLMNYRGYGDSDGEPGEAALKADAVFVIQALEERGLLDSRRSHLLGRSLGSGVALHVAAQLEVASLSLLTPYDSIAAVAAGRYPLFPVGLLIRHPFDSLAYMGQVAEPTLIIKAASDRVVPTIHADALIDAWQGPVQSITLPGTTHNRIYSPDFYRHMAAFLVTAGAA